MVMAVFMLFIIAVRFKILRDRIHLPFIALTLVVIMDGISTFYAVSGKVALREFLKVFLAYLMAVILLATSPKNEEIKGKRIATILAVCTGIASLIGIDMYSTGWISGAVVWALGRFTEVYGEYAGVMQSMNRMASIFANANVYAGFSGLGVILSLGLIDAAEQKTERCFFLLLLYMNALTFILTESLGAFFFGFIALIVFVLMHRTEHQLCTWVLLAESLFFAAVVVLVHFKTWTQLAEGKRWLTLLLTAAGAAALCGVDLLAGQRIQPSKKRGKTALIIPGICAAVVVFYVLAALSVTGDLQLKGGKTSAVLFPKAGTYSLAVEAEGDPLTVSVFSQNLHQSATMSQMDLYSGDAVGACFTVPEDSVALFFPFGTDGETHIGSASFGTYKIPLRYSLLPGFIADRLGDPLKNHNASQRLVYFQDGLKLFRRSPIVGLGIGAFENAIKSVQSYYYETKYAHNHYFQTMLETGIIGLTLFLLLLVTSAIAIWKSRTKQPFAPMLGAIWFFMAGQAVHDIVFSAYAYLPLAYGSFILIDLCCGEAITRAKLSSLVRNVTLGVISVCTVIYCIFIAGNLMAKRNIEREPTLQMLTQCVKLDRFEWADYALPYVINATGENINTYVRQQADEFAERLAQVNSNTIPIYLAEY